MDNRIKKVLFVSYLYPPGSPVGSERVLKFKKFLPESGYKAYILTTSLCGDLSDDKETATIRAFDPISLYNRIISFIYGARRKTSVKTLGETPAEEMVKSNFVKSVIWRIKQWIVIPDRAIIWLPFAVWKSYRLIHKEKMDVIVATSGPPTNLLVGTCLAILTGVPLVVDFRDGWIFESLQPFLRNNSLRKAIDGRLERFVIERSKAIISVSDPLTAYFRQTYNLSEENALTITNGYDPDNWRDVKEISRPKNLLRLVHTGALSGSRSTLSIIPFLTGLNSLTTVQRSFIEVLFIGNLLPEEIQAIEDLDLIGMVQVLPPVTRTQSLSYQMSADILLLVVGNDKSVATSKLYEYLFARHPILVIGSKGTTASKIVENARAGFTVEQDNKQAIAAAISQLMKLWQSGDLNIFGQGDISMFDRRYLSASLAGVLDRVIS
jgi:glycosyltransferase involved in cell wall biosynthesis